jgi:signal peptidase I
MKLRKIALLVAGVFIFFLLTTAIFFRLYKIYQISGTSMSPPLKEGEIVLMERGPALPQREEYKLIRMIGDKGCL